MRPLIMPGAPIPPPAGALVGRLVGALVGLLVGVAFPLFRAGAVVVGPLVGGCPGGSFVLLPVGRELG